MEEQSKEKLAKRARRKYLGYPALKHLLKLDSPNHKRYVTSLGCSSKIRLQDGKTHSRYCKRLWCTVCAPIRTAVRINKYKPVLEELEDLHLTTLTVPNIAAADLKSTLTKFNAIFRQFRNTWKKKTNKTFRGVQNYEITYNWKTGLFHPHIHIIHEGIPTYTTKYYKTRYNKVLKRKEKEYTLHNDLIAYWLEHIPTARGVAQDTRICYDLIEGFKYSAKQIYQAKINGERAPFMPIVELDQMYINLHGVKMFKVFGIKAITEEDIEKEMDELTAYESDKPSGVYGWLDHDWRNIYDFDITLSDFVPDLKTVNYHDKLQANQHYKNRIDDH